MQQAVISIAALTDIGRKRRTNQDSWLAERGVYMVCDGMGGESGGERASAIAVEELAHLAQDAHRTRLSIDDALERAQSRTRALGLTLGGIAGTTVTGIVLPQWFASAGTHGGERTHAPHHPQHSAQYHATAAFDAIEDLRPLPPFGQDWDATQPGADNANEAADHAKEAADAARFGEHRADIAPDAWSIAIRQLLPDTGPRKCYVVNIGDSRTYHMSPGSDGRWDAASLTQITRDHSRRQEAIDSGKMTPEEAERVIARNVITQCVGAPMGIDPDIFMADASGRFIICSDGCHSEIGDATMATIAARHDTADAAARALIDASLNAGGDDNVTVIVVDMPAHAAHAEEWTYGRLGDDEEPVDIGDATVETRGDTIVDHHNSIR